MLIIIMTIVAISALITGGLYVAVTIVSIVSDQFDELMPQRMIDYSGFVELGAPRD